MPGQPGRRGRCRAGAAPALLALLLLGGAVGGAEAAYVAAYKGYEYRVRDGTNPATTTSHRGCEDDYAALPAGFSVATDTTDSHYVTRAYQWAGSSSARWGTNCLTYSNGDAMTTYESTYDSGSCSCCYLQQSGSSYRVTNCNVRILVRRACRAGTYHGTSVSTYIQQTEAQCTSCPAGKSSAATGATTRERDT
jgi:hypothetical protein